MMGEKRFRRRVLPFEDVVVNVDLQDVITYGPGSNQAPFLDVLPLIEWIEDGAVQLHVVSPPHIVPQKIRQMFEAPERMLRMSGQDRHRRLCALAASYIVFLEKIALFDGASACTYSGGWADAVATDGSIFVECGTLSSTRKPIEAMLAGETLMILPYTLGCDGLDDKTIDRLDPGPAAEDGIENKYLKVGRVKLGYIFVPSDVLGNPLIPSREALLFQNNPTKGLAKKRSK